MQPLPELTRLILYREATFILNCAPHLQQLVIKHHARFPRNLFLPSLYELEAHLSVGVPHAQQTTLTKLVTFKVFPDGEWNISCLTNLRELSMEYGWTMDISPITNLESLGLRYTDPVIPHTLKFPEKLTTLKQWNAGSGNIDFAKFSNLIDLQLSGLSFETIVMNIDTLHSLTRLEIGGKIQHTYLSILTKLQDLKINGCNRKELESYELNLTPLTNLTSLHLSAENEFKNVKINAPKLRDLTLLLYTFLPRYNPPAIYGIDSLTNVTSLTGHNLYPCMDYADMLKLTTLKQLNVWLDQHDDLALLAKLSHLTSLRIRSIVHNAEDFQGLTKLQQLKYSTTEEKYKQKYLLKEKLPHLDELLCSTIKF